MAVFEKRFSNNNRIALRLTLQATGDVDIATNRSLWYWRVDIVEVVPPSVAYNLNRPPDRRAPYWECWVAGVQVGSGYFTYRFRTSSGAILLGEGYTWVSHDQDGTRRVEGSAGASGIPLGNVVVESVGSGALEAPRIIRGPRIKSGGRYRNSILYVKQGGHWRLAILYVKQGGHWRLAGG